MPGRPNSTLIQVGGALPGNERWQVGFWVDSDGIGGSQADYQAYIDSLVTPVSTWWNTSSIQGLVCTGCTLDTIRGYDYGPDGGTALRTASATFTALTATGAQTMPNQCALVVTELSVFPGRKGKGRIYLPVLKGSLSGNQLASTTTDNVATSTAALFSAVGGLPANTNVLAGTTQGVVTAVAVDTLIDTQRRRRNKLIANKRSTAAVT